MTEEVIIDIKPKTDDGAFNKLSTYKSALVNLKQEQKQLQEAYKKGTVTLNEYSDEMVRLDANVKKITNDYNKLQRQVTGVKSPFEELGSQIKGVADQVNVAGISLSTFANPVTATVGILGLLGKAYASSTVGAKDLEFVTNQLSFTFTVFSNKVLDLLGASGEDGQGPLTRVFNALIRGWSPGGVNAGAVITHQLAMAKEALDDLGREEMDVMNQRNIVLENISELQTKLQDSQISYGEKVSLSSHALADLRKMEEDLVSVKQRQLDQLELMLQYDKNNEDLQDAIKAKTIEISAVKRDVEKRVQSIQRAESNLLDTERKKTDQAEKQLRLAKEKDLLARMKTDAKIRKDFGKDVVGDTAKNVEALGEDWVEHNKKLRAGDLKEMKGYYKERQDIAKNAAEAQKTREEKMADYTVTLYANQISVYQQMIQQSNDLGTALLKGFLINMLRMLKAALQARIIGESFATLDSILSFGVSGAIRAAVLVGLLEGAFSVAENFISGFADGGVVSGTRISRSQGRPIRRSNGDNVLITAKDGEVILNEEHQAALGGDKTFKALGIPGFAGSGRVESEGSIVRESANNTYLKNLLNVLANRQVAVVIEQVELKLRQRAQIREQAQL